MSCIFNASKAFNTVKNHMEFEKLRGLNIKMKLTWEYVAKDLLDKNWCIDVSRQPCGIKTIFERDRGL